MNTSSGAVGRAWLVALACLGLAVSACSQAAMESSPPPDETESADVYEPAPDPSDDGDLGEAKEAMDAPAAANGDHASDDAAYDRGDEAAAPGRGPASVPDPQPAAPEPIEEEAAAPAAPARDTCQVGDLEAFDWPPPHPSARVTVPRALLLAGADSGDETLGEVSERLERALIAAGYVEYGYLHIGCSGFAMVTRMERIDEDGRPMAGAERYAPPERSESWSLSSYVARLFFAPPGYYRQIVFAATDRPYDPDNLADAPTREALDTMMARADVTALPETMLDRPFSRRHQLHALIYEFEKSPGDRNVAQLIPSRLQGPQHIEQAGIYTGLGRE